MSGCEDITLENLWTVSNYFLYLGEGSVNVELKNNLETSIVVEDVACRFETETLLDSYEAHSTKKQRVQPKGRVTIQVPFFVGLELTQFTNTYTVKVRYKPGSSQTEITAALNGCVTNSILIQPNRRSERYFFISHLIPEDSALAKTLDAYLRKIGFKGFLAEDNSGPGLDIWNEKIAPAIQDKNCLGVIVLWGPKAVTEPSGILRELKYAREYKKNPILLRGKEVSLPKSFPKKSKEYQEGLAKKLSETDLINLVKSIDNMYKTGKLDH